LITPVSIRINGAEQIARRLAIMHQLNRSRLIPAGFPFENILEHERHYRSGAPNVNRL